MNVIAGSTACLIAVVAWPAVARLPPVAGIGQWVCGPRRSGGALPDRAELGRGRLLRETRRNLDLELQRWADEEAAQQTDRAVVADALRRGARWPTSPRARSAVRSNARLKLVEALQNLR